LQKAKETIVFIERVCYTVGKGGDCMRNSTELQEITKQIVDRYSPEKLLLFGSQSKNRAKPNSDIDLCVVLATTNKRRLLADMYYSIEAEKPLDLVLYTPEEWAHNVMDKTSFAHLINTEGIVLYG
jgi:predicted nucleotidyltransferase